MFHKDIVACPIGSIPIISFFVYAFNNCYNKMHECNFEFVYMKYTLSHSMSIFFCFVFRDIAYIYVYE